MTDSVPETPHFNPPISAGKIRKELIRRDEEFKDWICLEIQRADENTSHSDKAVSRRKTNGEMKKWCVETTRQPWTVIQIEFREHHKLYSYTPPEIRTIFGFQNSGEASLFRLTFGGDIIEGKL